MNATPLANVLAIASYMDARFMAGDGWSLRSLDHTDRLVTVARIENDYDGTVVTLVCDNYRNVALCRFPQQGIDALTRLRVRTSRAGRVAENETVDATAGQVEMHPAGDFDCCTAPVRH